MDWIKTLFTFQWQKKLVAFLTAVMIWLFVNHTITDQKTISNVPIRILNLPEDKTVPGMQPNGIIGKRVPLTLKGTKDVIDALEPSDIEVQLDASTIEQNDWVIQISKKNLVSLNPSIDLSRHIYEVEHPEFVLRLSKMITAKVPITILKPLDHPPPGYEYLDIWPQQLFQTVVGPQEQVEELLKKGFELQLDTSLISKADLDKIKSTRENFHDNEVSFFIPSHWKKVKLPFKDNQTEDITDPEAQNLHIDFLRRQYLPIERDVVTRPFYPLATLEKLNPTTAPLIAEGKLKKSHDVAFLHLPLYVRDVSPLFLEIVRDHITIIITVEEMEDNAPLHWNLQVIDPHLLEERYVKALVSHNSHGTVKNTEPRHTKKREHHLRARFRNYLQKLALFTAPDKKLQLDARLTKEGISVVPHAL